MMSNDKMQPAKKPKLVYTMPGKGLNIFAGVK
jgi:hypothetical protein